MRTAELFEQVAVSLHEQTTSGPISEAEIAALEEKLGHRLPGDFRQFLARFGSGLWGGRHELYGPSHVFMLDVELVDDILSVKIRLEKQGLLARGQLPFHGDGEAHHAFDLAFGDDRSCPVVTLPTGPTWRTFTDFFSEVVIGVAVPTRQDT